MSIKGRKLQIAIIAILIAVTLWAAWFVFLRPSPPAHTATIWVDGRAIMEVELTTQYQYISLNYLGMPVNFEVENGHIRFIDVTCPDEVCMNTGWLEIEGQTAICMPNRVSVTV